MTSKREIESDGWRVSLSLTQQVLRLEIPEDFDYSGRGRRGPIEPPLSAVPPYADDCPVSAATLLLMAKRFDDRLYASLELAAQRGAGRFAGKATLLRSLATTLASGLPDSGVAVATLIHTACELGGVPVAVPEAIASAARLAQTEFLRDEGQSKPLGFYTSTPELSAIFRQDRFLQQALDPDVADDLIHALEQTPGASDTYNACLRLCSRLTNPPKLLGLRDAGKRPPFFPSSRSHEVTLFERLYEDRPIPEGFDLMGELIRRVRSGELRLMLDEASGWHDHQTWSLEPLLLPDHRPESARLEWGKRYRKYLEDLFRGALALARETQVKQAGGGRGGYGGPVRPPIYVRPNLTVEPLPSVYARRAASYRFVRSVIEEVFGNEALDSLQRVAPDWTTKPDLAAELTWVEERFTGAAAVALKEIGMGQSDGSEAAVRRFSVWRDNLRADSEMSRDTRMMVPVFYDEQRRKWKVWALLGWHPVTVNAEYRIPPEVVAIKPLSASKSSSPPPQVLFSDESYQMAVPVLAEVYVRRLLDRDDFRRHCDRHKTRAAIVANLSDKVAH